MNQQQLYEAIFDDEIHVHGSIKKIKRVVKLTKVEKEQHDALIKNLEDAKDNENIAKNKYHQYELVWDKLEKSDQYWAERNSLIEINTKHMYLVSGAQYKLFMFEYNWKTRGYEEYEQDYPDSNPEIDASEEEMRRWDEEDPSWRIANDLD